MKQYLLDTFYYNDWANTQLVTAIEALPEKVQALKLMLHLITTQNKWFNRLTNETEDSTFAWFGEVYLENEIKDEWKKSLNKWLIYLEKLEEENLEEDFYFINPASGKKMQLKIKDLLLQLNYHCIHHRAQINSLFSSQGLKAPATDYIFTMLKEVD